jgi:hypothetical protein
LRFDSHGFGVVLRLGVGDLLVAALFGGRQVVVAAADDVLRHPIARSAGVGGGSFVVVPRLIELSLDDAELGERLSFRQRNEVGQAARAEQ